MPSVDSHAHEGVDIDMRPVKPANSPGAPHNISENTIEHLYSGAGAKKPHGNVKPFRRRENNKPPPSGVKALPPPQTMTIIPPKKPESATAAKPQTQSAQPGTARRAPPKATVRLRLTLQEFIRLRLAARDLESNCQSLLLEALDCYLEANDIAPVSRADMEQELQRLRAQKKARRVS